MRLVRIVMITVFIFATGGILFALSGIYDVSARAQHTRIIYWLLHTARNRSIARHSSVIKLPSREAPELARKGSIHFDATCRRCHGAPGQLREEFAQGLYPGPPPLEITANKLNASAIFWVIENGIKMTGMPAFGENHDKDELIGMAAFIEKLPNLEPFEYKQFVAKAKSQYGGHEHHGDEGLSPPETQPDEKGHEESDEHAHH